MSDADDAPRQTTDNACLAALERQIDAVPPRTTATISVPDECPVSTADVLNMGDTVKSVAFDQKDGAMSPVKLLVQGTGKKAPEGS